MSTRIQQTSKIILVYETCYLYGSYVAISLTIHEIGNFQLVLCSPWLLRVGNFKKIFVGIMSPTQRASGFVAGVSKLEKSDHLDTVFFCSIWVEDYYHVMTADCTCVFQSKTEADVVSNELLTSDPLQIDDSIIRGSNICPATSGWMTQWRRRRRWLLWHNSFLINYSFKLSISSWLNTTD